MGTAGNETGRGFAPDPNTLARLLPCRRGCAASFRRRTQRFWCALRALAGFALPLALRTLPARALATVLRGLGRCGDIGCRPSGPADHGDGLFQQLFNGLQFAHLGGCAKGDRIALGPGACGATDPVDVVFRHIGHVEIINMPDAGNINAARGNIGGHQHIQLTLTELGQGAVAVVLAFVAMDGRGFEPPRPAAVYTAFPRHAWCGQRPRPVRPGA